MSPDIDPSSRALIVDYGGVLTQPVGRAFRAFEEAEGLPEGTVVEILIESYREGTGRSALARFEKGEIQMQEFEEGLHAELRSRGHDVGGEELISRLFGGMGEDDAMWELVATARAAGVRTVLLSNSWGVDGYPREKLADHFDALVISGEVGLRKPDAAIYELAAERADRPVEDCAFVDDLEINVEAAAALGMLGVHHRGVSRTAEALTPFLGIPLTE